jgi:hypothetical protein
MAHGVRNNPPSRGVSSLGQGFGGGKYVAIKVKFYTHEKTVSDVHASDEISEVLP